MSVSYHRVGIKQKAGQGEAAEAVGLSRPAVTQRMARLKGDWEDLQEEALH